MKPYQKLREVHDILTAYQRTLPKSDVSIARIVTAIEEELQRKPVICHCCGQEYPSINAADWATLQQIGEKA